MAQKPAYAVHFEYLEFVKLYKYSVPLFYSVPNGAASLNENIAATCVLFDAEKYTPNYCLGRSVGDNIPVFLNKGEDILIETSFQIAHR